MKVLIADDSEIIRNSLIKLLSSIKFVGDIYEAQDVDEANDLISSINPDIMIVDIKMPGGSGFDVLKKARAEENDATIIVLTNYPNDQFRRKSMSLGARYFFDKSKDFKKIIDICSHYRENREYVA